MPTTVRPVLRAGLVLGCALVMAACGSKREGATQVAAKVNKEEISVHQINFLMQRQGNLKPEQVETASRKTLDALIDQELALQAANEQRLDRDPRVVQAIEASRRDILARAYAERLAESAAVPTEKDIADYYNTHPELFAQRRVYALVETAVEATPAQQQALKPQLDAAKNADEVAAALRVAGLRFGTRQLTQGADALPMQAAAPMATLKEGQSQVIAGPLGARILTIVSVKPAPLAAPEAKNAIQQYLLVDRKRQVVDQQLKQLRAAARIEYQGKFAQAAGEAAPADGVAPVVVTTPTADVSATSTATSAASPAASSSTLDASSVNKGLSNLK
jgi:EpsD family peptidyl-prolyl cis-trans isomerase